VCARAHLWADVGVAPTPALSLTIIRTAWMAI